MSVPSQAYPLLNNLHVRSRKCKHVMGLANHTARRRMLTLTCQVPAETHLCPGSLSVSRFGPPVGLLSIDLLHPPPHTSHITNAPS